MTLTCLALTGLFMAGGCTVQTTQQPPEMASVATGGDVTPAMTVEKKRIVTPQDFIRAETDRYFTNAEKRLGGVNKIHSNRALFPLDIQPVIRMNKDTLYASALIDSQGGATITVPELPKDRYVSVHFLDNDHYTPLVIDKAGTYAVPQDSKYIYMIIRIELKDPDDPKEYRIIHALQDKFILKASSHDPMPPFQWDMDSLNGLRAQYEAEYQTGKQVIAKLQGRRGEVDERYRHIPAAVGWGLLPEREATYLAYSGPKDMGRCYMARYQIPENRAFWSLTVYGGDGYMKHDNNVLNRANTQLNADGNSFDVYFGSQALCGDRPNRLDVAQGWNFLLRVYRPGPSVTQGRYSLPEVRAVQQ